MIATRYRALVSGLFIVVSALFSLLATSLQAATAWPLWALYIGVTTATLLCFAGYLREQVANKVS